jgi:hypothetical protein
MHCCNQCFHSANTLTNISGSIDIRIADTALLGAMSSSKNRPARQRLRCPNSQETQGARPGLYGGWSSFLIPNLSYFSEARCGRALSRWRKIPLAFNFGQLNGLSSTILGGTAPMKKSLLELCPAGSITPASIPVRENSIQNMCFLDVAVCRTPAGVVTLESIHMDVRGLSRHSHVSSPGRAHSTNADVCGFPGNQVALAKLGPGQLFESRLAHAAPT